MVGKGNNVGGIPSFFFQAEDGIRVLVRSRGLGDVYKRQGLGGSGGDFANTHFSSNVGDLVAAADWLRSEHGSCLLYTSDAADDLLCVDLGGRRIIKKQNPSLP